MAGWPAHAVILLAGKPGRRLERRIPNEANLRDLPPQHTFIRVANAEPLSASWDVGGAGVASRRDLRDVGGVSGMGAAEETYPAWRKSRLEKKGALWAQREWRECQFRQLGQRYPAGDAQDAGAGIANFFQAPGKVGFPPTMKTNGLPGFSRMAY